MKKSIIIIFMIIFSMFSFGKDEKRHIHYKKIKLTEKARIEEWKNLVNRKGEKLIIKTALKNVVYENGGQKEKLDNRSYMFYEYNKNVGFFIIQEKNEFGMNNFILLNSKSGYEKSINSCGNPIFTEDGKRVIFISGDESGDNFNGIKIFILKKGKIYSEYEDETEDVLKFLKIVNNTIEVEKEKKDDNGKVKKIIGKIVYKNKKWYTEGIN